MSHALVFSVALLFPFLGMAQDAYPTKPITMVVPFPPGGKADLVGRPLGAAMERILRQPVVVSNRAGGAGALGMRETARAASDGYTILMALSSISIYPVSERLMGKQPSYQLSDFAPIALITSDPAVLVVRADTPYETVDDLVKAAKVQPGKIRYASSGPYGTLHVAMEMFAQAAGVRLSHVPYEEGERALRALLRGEVQALASGHTATIVPSRTGKMRQLANSGGKRMPQMPELPTLKELGYDTEFYLWTGLFAPAATPGPVLERLREAVGRAVDDVDFREEMAKIITLVTYLDAPAFQGYLAQDAKRLAVALERMGTARDGREK